MTYQWIIFGTVILQILTDYSTPMPEPRKINIFNQKNNLFQGDIANIPKNYKKLRNGIIFNKWTSARIPYVNQVAAGRQGLVQSAMRRIEQMTCVRFIPRTTENNYVIIRTTKDGCYSSVGMDGGIQDISLQDDITGTCMTFDTVLHELLHSVGLYHEQSRYDRDNYITVNYANIAQDDRSQFDIVGPADSSFYQTQYDYLSVMHYDARAFSKNGGYTIVPKDSSYLSRIGNVKDASATDWLKVNRIYNCLATAPCSDFAPASLCSTYIRYCNDPNVYNSCKKTCNRCT